VFEQNGNVGERERTAKEYEAFKENGESLGIFSFHLPGI